MKWKWSGAAVARGSGEGRAVAMAVAVAVAVAVAMAEAVAIPCLLTSKSVDEIQGIIHACDGRHRRISSVTAACPPARVARWAGAGVTQGAEGMAS